MRTITTTVGLGRKSRPTERYFENRKVMFTSQENLVVVRHQGELNGFFFAALEAWANHHHFSFRPDDVWLLVLQGIATHAQENSEEVRKRFVDFEGKRVVTVREEREARDRDSVYLAFFEAMRKDVKHPELLLDVSFSTTTTFDRTVFATAAMAMTKNYFTRRWYTMCGFPSVTLKGEVGDWERLRVAVKGAIETFCLQTFSKRWLEALVPILDRFVSLDPNPNFWNCMIKRGGTEGSGSKTWYDGWVHAFFPYLWKNEKYVLNQWCVNVETFKANDDARSGAELEDFPSGLSIAPAELFQTAVPKAVEFCAGFVATFDVATSTVTPSFVRFIRAAEGVGVEKEEEEGEMILIRKRKVDNPVVFEKKRTLNNNPFKSSPGGFL